MRKLTGFILLLLRWTAEFVKRGLERLIGLR